MILPGSLSLLLAVCTPLFFLALLFHILCRSLSRKSLARFIISVSGSRSSIAAAVTRTAIEITVSTRTSARTPAITLTAAKARPAISLKSVLSISLRSAILSAASPGLVLSVFLAISLAALTSAPASVVTVSVLGKAFLPPVPLVAAFPCGPVLSASAALGSPALIPVSLSSLPLRPVVLEPCILGTVILGSFALGLCILRPVILSFFTLGTLILRTFPLSSLALDMIVLGSLILRLPVLYTFILRFLTVHCRCLIQSFFILRLLNLRFLLL